MSEGDYIHIADVGKLFSSTRYALDLKAKRDKALNISEDTPRAEFNAITDAEYRLDSSDILEFARKYDVNDETMILSLKFLYGALVDDPDLAADFKRIMMKVMLVHSTDMYELKAQIRRAREAHNANRNAVLENNRIRRLKAENNNQAYAKVTAENQVTLVARKRKLIGSMNKALERAGQPELLSQSDLFVFRLMESWDWVGHDGSRFCCKEQIIYDAPDEEFSQKLWDILEYLKN